MKQSILLGVFALLLHQSTLAQTAFLSGKVIDQNSEETLAAARLILQSTNYGVISSTDVDGRISYRYYPAGNYQLICSFEGFKTDTTALTLLADSTLYIEVNMMEDPNYDHQTRTKAKASYLKRAKKYQRRSKRRIRRMRNFKRSPMAERKLQMKACPTPHGIRLEIKKKEKK